MRLVIATDIAWKSIQPEQEVLARVDARLVLAKTGSEAELLELAPEAEAILTNWAKVPASVVRAAPRLQVIGRYGIGVDNIAVDEATRLGIPVTNVPAYCLDEVSEHALALLLACARKVVQYNAGAHAGEWSAMSQAPLFRINGKTLGLVGFGKIARRLAPLAHALGLCILVYDPYAAADVVAGLGCAQVGLDELLSRADFVSIHCPLTEQTRGMIDAQRLRLMKPGAYLINTSRGAVVDQGALAQAVAQGTIAGAALDVFSPEPLPGNHPLYQMPNVILTPHVSFYSEESVRELEAQAAENVAAIFSGRRPASVVNPEVLELPRWKHLI